MYDNLTDMADKVYVTNQFFKDRAINTGFRMYRDITSKRGHGWRVIGKGVKDHFIADFAWQNTMETAETLMRMMQQLHTLELHLFKR